MSKLAISVENVSKLYWLGEVDTASFYSEVRRWWAQRRNSQDPLHQLDDSDGGGRQGKALWALRNVSFSLNQGDVLGIIGSNGSGKSTLLKIISRVTAPTYGEVKMKGRVASLLEVGTGFHPELTGRENVFLNSALLGMSRRDVQKRFDEIVDFSGIDKFIDTPVKHYSSGMYVRLAFSVASYLDSDILIIDEVLAVGDATFQKKSLEKMESVAKSGKTVIFVSHSLAAVRRLCSKGIYLVDGKIVTSGTAKEAVAGYLKALRLFDVKVDESKQTLTSYAELTDSPYRWKGYVEKVMVSASLHRITGEQSASYNVGDSLIVRVAYHLEREITGYCRINFLDYAGAYVMTLHNTHNGPKLSMKGDGVLECVIHDLRLVAGDYSLMIEIGDDSKSEPVWLDCVSNALVMRVQLADYVGGVGTAQGEVTFVQKSQWRILDRCD